MATGDPYTLWGQGSVSDAEAREHESLLLAKRTMSLPNNQHIKVDSASRADNQPVYIGVAPRSLSTSSSGWLLIKITYDSNGDFSEKTIGYDSWDNRATATYA